MLASMRRAVSVMPLKSLTFAREELIFSLLRSSSLRHNQDRQGGAKKGNIYVIISMPTSSVSRAVLIEFMIISLCRLAFSFVLSSLCRWFSLVPPISTDF